MSCAKVAYSIKFVRNQLDACFKRTRRLSQRGLRHLSQTEEWEPLIFEIAWLDLVVVPIVRVTIATTRVFL